MKVSIYYYNTYGKVYKVANLVAEGVAGAEPVVRTVPELIPAAIRDSRLRGHRMFSGKIGLFSTQNSCMNRSIFFRWWRARSLTHRSRQ